ncbi:hypothetical protein PFISCL1PPCAC_5312, partial [Pristionchus fissidentatus]
ALFSLLIVSFASAQSMADFKELLNTKEAEIPSKMVEFARKHFSSFVAANEVEGLKKEVEKMMKDDSEINFEDPVAIARDYPITYSKGLKIKEILQTSLVKLSEESREFIVKGLQVVMEHQPLYRENYEKMISNVKELMAETSTLYDNLSYRSKMELKAQFPIVVKFIEAKEELLKILDE